MSGIDTEIVTRLLAALPAVRQWIDDLLRTTAPEARPVDSLGYCRLADCYPIELLESSHVVVVAHVPFPPIDRYGLPELGPLQRMPLAGITFEDTFFAQEGELSESLCFHELVHVVQWARLGVDGFLKAYGVGLLQRGYLASPLEVMAYSLQKLFEAGRLPEGLVGIIEKETDAIASQVESFFAQAS